MTQAETVQLLVITHSTIVLEASLSMLDEWQTEKRAHPRGWKYFVGMFDAEDRRGIRVAVLNAEPVSGTSMREKVQDVISLLRPALIVSCDIAEVPWTVPIGTVVVASEIEEQLADRSWRRLPLRYSEQPQRVRIAIVEAMQEFVRRIRRSPEASAAKGVTQGRLGLLSVGFSGIEDASAPGVMQDGARVREALGPAVENGAVVIRIAIEGEASEDEARSVVRFGLLFAEEHFSRDDEGAESPGRVRPSPHEDRDLSAATVGRVVVRDFKNVSSLELDLRSKSAFGGQWVCIAGINGAGKSAVLQALVLALMGPRFASELGGSTLKRMRRLRNGEACEASVEAVLRYGETTDVLTLPITDHGTSLSDGIARRKMETVWEARASRHLLLAYGPGRNLSEHIDSRHDGKSPEVRRVITLFDPLAQVASAEAILRERSDAAAVLKTARGLLREVFDESFFTLDDDETTLRFRSGGASLPAVDLPDGFRATIAWLVDLCANWHAIAPDLAASGDHHEIRGLVVIDEIDLHLHPRLQRVLVPRLRSALPHVQWVVSTHSPLVLGCFDRNEIVMLERDAAGGVTRRDLDRDVAGFSTDEIYEWLMGTPPRGAALDAMRDAEGNITAEAARYLAQSPDHDGALVERAYAFRQSKARQSAAASGVREPADTQKRNEEPKR